MRARGWISQAVVLAALTSSTFAQDSISWQPSLDAAQQLAARTNRLVLVHCWRPNCPPCVRVDKEVFSRPETARALDANFVMVKLNCDDSLGTARMYGVTSTPTELILTPSGHLVASFNSPPTESQYLAAVNQAASNYRDASRRAAAPAGPVSSQTQPASAMIPVGAPANSNAVAPEAAAAQAPSVSSSPPASNDRYADYFNRRGASDPSPSVSASGSSTMPPPVPVTVNPYIDAAAATAPGAAQQTAATPPPSTNPPPGYAPGSIATAYPQQPAAAPGSPPLTQQASQQPTHGMAAQPPANPNIQLPPGSPPLGFDGYCPVALSDRNQWVVGDKAWGVVHRGRTYLFCGPEEQKKFWANPELYSPVLSGNDPVLALDRQVTVPGKREFGVFYNNRVYLFADEASLQTFVRNTSRYAAEVVQAMR